MSNNNCLPHWDAPMDSLDHFSPQTSLLESPLNYPFKESDLFIKSQVSMADTACDDHSPISHKFQDNATHQHSFSLTQFNLEDSRSGTDDESTCNDFLEKGFCMRGIQCTKLHDQNVENCHSSQEKPSLFLTLFNSLPEILILCRTTKAYLKR